LIIYYWHYFDIDAIIDAITLIRWYWLLIIDSIVQRHYYYYWYLRHYIIDIITDIITLLPLLMPFHWLFARMTLIIFAASLPLAWAIDIADISWLLRHYYFFYFTPFDISLRHYWYWLYYYDIIDCLYWYYIDISLLMILITPLLIITYWLHYYATHYWAITYIYISLHYIITPLFISIIIDITLH
jgi:hypothetical protein